MVILLPQYNLAQCGAGSITEIFQASGTTIQTWTVPAGVTQITITTVGADGGNATNGTPDILGGSGATAIATFAVTPTTVLEIIVGNQGQTETIAGGGGAGSGVKVQGTIGTNVLIVAGGGGGAGSTTSGRGGNNALNGAGLDGFVGGFAGGGGFGGGGGFAGGGGGGGVLGIGNIGGGGGGNPGDGGFAGDGGIGSPNFGGGGGGLGGGGSSGGVSIGGGGGGGFSGSGGGHSGGSGGGGGSFINTSGVGTLTAGTNGGGMQNNGSVTICYFPPTTVPTLSEWGLILLSLLILIIGVGYATAPNMQAASGIKVRNFSIRNLPFESKSVFKMWGMALFSILAFFAMAAFFFEYEMTSADPFGIFGSSFLVGYLSYLILNEHKYYKS